MPLDWTGVADGATGGLVGGGFTVLALRTTLRHDRDRMRRERLDQAIESVQDAAADLVKETVRTGEVQAHDFQRLRRAHLRLLQRIPATTDPQDRHEMDTLWQTATEQFPQVFNRMLSPTFLVAAVEAYTTCVATAVGPVEFEGAQRALQRWMPAFLFRAQRKPS